MTRAIVSGCTPICGFLGLRMSQGPTIVLKNTRTVSCSKRGSVSARAQTPRSKTLVFGAPMLCCCPGIHLKNAVGRRLVAMVVRLEQSFSKQFSYWHALLASVKSVLRPPMAEFVWHEWYVARMKEPGQHPVYLVCLELPVRRAFN